MEEEAVYTLMGTTEADPMNNVISIDSQMCIRDSFSSSSQAR